MARGQVPCHVEGEQGASLTRQIQYFVLIRPLGAWIQTYRHYVIPTIKRFCSYLA